MTNRSDRRGRAGGLRGAAYATRQAEKAAPAKIRPASPNRFPGDLESRGGILPLYVPQAPGDYGGFRFSPVRSGPVATPTRQRLECAASDGGLQVSVKRGSWFAVPIGLVLAALPALAGVCELRCAAVENAQATRVSAAPSLPGPESCPLHVPAGSRTSPTGSRQGPCHGQRDGRGGTILLVSGSVRTLVAPQEFSFFEPAGPPVRGETPTVSLRREGAFARSPGAPSLRSILRV
jgi:hypothetical protein